MVAALIVISILLVAYIIYAYMKSNQGNSATVFSPQGGKGIPSSARSSAASAADDEEATRVRVVGPRLVRVMGGLRVGDEMPMTTPFTIGRGQSCTYTFHDAEMSSSHAEFRLDGSQPIVIDMGSTNGTFVNDQKIDANSAFPLKDGDQVKLGTMFFLFKQVQ
ncbi:MAG: FHA domain-containing protein [Fimbriimonas sp.]|nr:FHA domain-containing protein [Fimbriimonas sp.]